MFELRWTWHDFKDGQPSAGSMCVGDRAYLKLQYRSLMPEFSKDGRWVADKLGEWKDVKIG